MDCSFWFYGNGKIFYILKEERLEKYPYRWLKSRKMSIPAEYFS